MARRGSSTFAKVFVVMTLMIAVVMPVSLLTYPVLARSVGELLESTAKVRAAEAASVVDEESVAVEEGSVDEGADAGPSSSSESRSNAALPEGHDTPSSDEASSASTSSTSALQVQDAMDLSWRDTDFAVDPARSAWTDAQTDEKVVYLTIDDGPSYLTAEVLDILDRYGVKATFFVTGNDPDSYHYIREAYERGHTIGLHTYSHDYASIYASVDAYFADLDAIGEVVREQIGYVPCFIRFPGGSSNEVSANYAPGIMSALVDAVRKRGYQYFDWNASTGDGAVHTADEIAGYGIETYGNSTVMLLCHDSSTKATTAEALPRIIEYYLANGFSFRAIDRNAPAIHQYVNN